jgi:excisionase family DNA binding protein
MYGCYTKKQTSEILGVSERKVGELLSAGEMRRLEQGRKVWIPEADVQRLYSERVTPVIEVHAPSSNELEQRLLKLEAGFETLKLGMGFGAPRRARTKEELEVMRLTHISMLGDGAWGVRVMSQLADDLMSLQEDEVLLLLRGAGSRAWVPLVDLTMRMVRQLESDPDYPQAGRDVLLARLIRAKDRFYGVLYANAKRSNATGAGQMGRALTATEVPLKSIESHVLAYTLA